MADLKWVVDEALLSGCKEGATNCILNALALSEQETIGQYQYACNALKKLYADEPEKAEVFSKLINAVTEDEGNHAASFMKAAAIVAGYKPAAPDEYNKAVKGNGNESV